MKIGILTFHFGYNYGALMQCYALQQYLSSCGHNVKIINYTPSNIKSKQYWMEIVSKSISISKIRKIIKKIRYAPNQKKSFNFFRYKYLNITELYNYEKLSNISNEFDAIIVGSDQIWNPSQHKLGSYFLAHLIKFKGKRISYAPCCAFNKVEIGNRSLLKIALKKNNIRLI